MSSALDRWLNPAAFRTNGQTGTAAPGTNSRSDLTTPERDSAVTAHNVPGSHPDSLGYPMHGDGVVKSPDEPRLAHEAAARMAHDASLMRFPHLASHGRAGPAVPEYNVLYSHLRDRDGVTQVISNTAHGTWVIGTTTKQPIILDTPANLRLSQFPGAIAVYPTLLLWTWGQSVTTATGEYSMVWELNGGDGLVQFPLGEFNASRPDMTDYPRWIVPMPITDANQTTMGNLIVTSNGVTGTPSIFWRMGIGWAYLLPAPAMRGYVPLRAGQAWAGETVAEGTN